jgi:hypothetical protein
MLIHNSLWCMQSRATRTMDSIIRVEAVWWRIKHEWGDHAAKKLLIDNPSAMIQGAEVLDRKPTQARERSGTVPVPW